MSAEDQLTLPLDAAPRFGREDFLVGRANEAAFAYISRWPRWLSPAAVIAGPEGAGKSHLAVIFAAASDARMLRADHLHPDDVPLLSRERALVIEDCDRFPPPEAALFHLLNLSRESGQFIVMTARLAPDGWQVRTPDLLSRLRLSPLLTLAEPDDPLLGALYVKLFADRQLSVEANVLSYAMARADRSFAGVNRLVGELDQLSLVRKKPVTRAMVAECIGASDDFGEDSGVTENGA